MKLEISLFRFDHELDYLPYYTKNYFTIGNEKTLLDIFNTLNEENKFSYKKCEDFLVCVNGVYTTLKVSIDTLVKNFGKDLIIEPLSIRRAGRDFIINTDDFKEKFKILKNFTNKEITPSYVKKEIKELYKSLKVYFYASNTINIEKKYIGDSILILASMLIEKYPQFETKILSSLQKEDFGAIYHTDLSSRILDFDPSIETRIQEIQEKLNITNNVNELKLKKKNKIDFLDFKNNKKIAHDFKKFNIAYFHENKINPDTQELLDNLNAKKLNLRTMYNDLALSTFNTNKEFTYKLAAEILLDAFDNDADFIVVDEERYFYLFDNNMAEIQRVAQRDVNIPIILNSELALLANGLHQEVKTSLDKHSINPEII